MSADSSKPLIIAEAGVNHNGCLKRAIEMVHAAKEAGADYIKFQYFNTNTLVASGAQTAAYQARNTGETDQSALLKTLEIDASGFEKIATACSEKRIGFLATAFEVSTVDYLVQLGMERIKVASGELTNVEALERFAKMGKPIFLSTGMASLSEVDEAVRILQRNGAREITLLQCTSLYPAPFETLNLRAMITMRDSLKLPVGFSDHSIGDHAALAAVALGASVIEKHFTLDRNLPGPDHAASLEPSELRAMIKRLHDIYSALGSGIKEPAEAERETAQLVRRSWHTRRALDAGTVLTSDDVTLKRPASGLAPVHSPIGLKLRHSLTADVPVRGDDLIQ